MAKFKEPLKLAVEVEVFVNDQGAMVGGARAHVAERDDSPVARRLTAVLEVLDHVKIDDLTPDAAAMRSKLSQAGVLIAGVLDDFCSIDPEWFADEEHEEDVYAEEVLSC